MAPRIISMCLLSCCCCFSVTPEADVDGLLFDILKLERFDFLALLYVVEVFRLSEPTKDVKSSELDSVS